LFIGVAVVILGCVVVAGLVSRRKAWPGQAVAGGLGAIGFVAVLTRPDLGQLAVLAPAASLLVGVAGFAWLHRQAVDTADWTAEDRRRFLRVSTGVVVGAGVFGLGGELLANRVDVEKSRRSVGRLRVAEPAPRLPAGAEFPGTSSFITSNADFYRIDTALTVPRMTAENWHLTVHGMVDRELELYYDDIRDRPLVERPITMACVSNDVGGSLVSTANFIGVPLRDILNEAGVRKGADQLLSTSVDGFTAGSPIDTVLDPDRGALLAIGMNGEPLPQEHGFPARLVVPGLYGYVSATKWVVDLEVTTFAAAQAYWVPRGWSQQGPIKTECRIDVPTNGKLLQAGKLQVAGVAWAQHKGIDAVEVRVSGGLWHEATLAAVPGIDTWRQWVWDWDATPGTYLIEARATDKTGYTQTSAVADVAPNGAAGYPSTQLTVS
jgi:DMSO/TMAO reductase YedYZ molybdopterin-dependent catalytic subunit